VGFTKLDEGILQSSVMAADPVTFKVWIALLAACGCDGVARVAPTFLASVCRLDIGAVVKALDELCGPDPYSRSPENDGRRVERCDGGWRITNHAKYRGWTYSQKPAAIRKRRQRDSAVTSRDADVTVGGTVGDVVGPSASASLSVVVPLEGGPGGDPRPEHERIRGSNFREASDLDVKILRVVRQISERTGKPAWEVTRKVTSYRRRDGEMSAGVEDPARLGSILARQKALEDAEWWLAELDKEAAGGKVD